MNARRNALTALFDLDGTLIDSIELIWSCYRHTALVHTSRAPDDEFWLAGLGRPLAWQFATALSCRQDGESRFAPWPATAPLT